MLKSIKSITTTMMVTDQFKNINTFNEKDQKKTKAFNNLIFIAIRRNKLHDQ